MLTELCDYNIESITARTTAKIHGQLKATNSMNPDASLRNTSYKV
jgi:hypothetical protein